MVECQKEHVSKGKKSRLGGTNCKMCFNKSLSSFNINSSIFIDSERERGDRREKKDRRMYKNKEK
jgi:hypothetical protein